MAFDFSGLGSGIGDISSGVGGLFAVGGYAQAAKIAQQNAQIVKQSTGIQEQQQQRQAFQVLGATEANAEAGGGTLQGSAYDVFKSNAQQLSLNRALVGEQGLIEENAWLEKAAADEGQAMAATAGGIGGIIGGALQVGAVLAAA